MAAGFWSKNRIGGLSVRRMILWLVLALPAGAMLQGLASGSGDPHALLHPTGELGIRLMLLAMLIGPLIDIFGNNPFLRLWLSVRRNLGVAAFIYSALHLIFYFMDKGTLALVIEELAMASIWTGWLSFAAMLAAASISTDWAVRRLGRWWKKIQMGVYAAYFLAAIHWWLLDDNPVPGLIHLAPLLIVWTLRVPMRKRRLHKRGAHAA